MKESANSRVYFKLLRFETRHKVDNTYTSPRKTLVTHPWYQKNIIREVTRDDEDPWVPKRSSSTKQFGNFADGQRSENSVTLLIEGAPARVFARAGRER